MAHKHRWRVTSFSYPPNAKIGERCRCGEHRERAPKFFETLALDRYRRSQDRAHSKMFVANHDFGRLFKNDDGTWKYQGYELMELVEQWAERYDGVHLLHCDDATHANSTICIIENQMSNEWMGLMVYVIPQHHAPCGYFLYPEDHDSMLVCLSGLRRKRRRVKLRQRLKELRLGLQLRIAHHLF